MVRASSEPLLSQVSDPPNISVGPNQHRGGSSDRPETPRPCWSKRRIAGGKRKFIAFGACCYFSSPLHHRQRPKSGFSVRCVAPVAEFRISYPFTEMPGFRLFLVDNILAKSDGQKGRPRGGSRRPKRDQDAALAKRIHRHGATEPPGRHGWSPRHHGGTHRI